MRDDPFAKLGALDQKLFTTSAPPPAHSVVETPRLDDSLPDQEPKPSSQSAAPTAPEPDKVGKEGSREVGKEGRREASQEASGTQIPPFDLSIKPYRKDSYLFTDEEFEAMEDLKLDLRRKYEVKATKNDLARCAIGYLITEFKRNRDHSIAVRRLRDKK